MIRVLDAEQPTRHVFAAVRRGSEESPHLAAVLGALTAAAEAKAADREVSLHD